MATAIRSAAIRSGSKVPVAARPGKSNANMTTLMMPAPAKPVLETPTIRLATANQAHSGNPKLEVLDRKSVV